MAETSCASASNDEQELIDIRNIIWGPNIRLDVFRRWSQGFEFSDVEPSALVQRQGGPCAVIAPVQAFLLKTIIMEAHGHSLGDLTTDKCKTLLIQAICNILMKCKDNKYRLVKLDETKAEANKTGQGISHETGQIMQESSETLETDDTMNETSTSQTEERMVEAVTLETDDKMNETPTLETDNKLNETSTLETDDKMNETPPQDTDAKIICDDESHMPVEWSPDEFHERLTVINFDNIDEIEKYYSENLHMLTENYGVLLFMYAVFLTKKLDNAIAELLDTSEPLIHNIYGYGSQGLINLMLTGQAVPHVWDHDKDVGGLSMPILAIAKLRGLSQQSDIGFITLMEQMRYCTVGSFYKNPKNPVWVMGSETHLTVLFSNEKRLVSQETPSEVARRVFKSYDPEGNNFIPTPVLQDVLCTLDLVSDPEYVDIMSKKLDPECLGIILLNAFMDEFFPEEKRSVPDTFDLLHYNGIPGSNSANKVQYYQGAAILLECDLKSISISNPMLTCLQTKWPNIEVNWNDSRTPSLN